jgi:hypothetical protein
MHGSGKPVCSAARTLRKSAPKKRRCGRNEVTQPRGDAKQVFVRNLRANETVNTEFTVGLGAIGFGVAPAGSKVKDTGYFVLDVAGRGRNQRVEPNDGRTETCSIFPRATTASRLGWWPTTTKSYSTGRRCPCKSAGAALAPGSFCALASELGRVQLLSSPELVAANLRHCGEITLTSASSPTTAPAASRPT